MYLSCPVCVCTCAAGVFAWVGGPLKAGTRCMLAYNCRSGPLAFTNSAKLHLGYDGWYNKEKQVSETGCVCVCVWVEQGWWCSQR